MRRPTIQQLVTASILIGALALIAGCGGEAETPTPKGRKFTIVATGLTKGNLYPQVHHYSRGRTRVLGGFASVVSKVKELVADRSRRGGSVLVDLGGNLAGSAESYASQGKIVVDMMNHLPYAASLLSNLEFSFGLQTLQARASQARFPFLASNLSFAGPELSKTVRREVTTEIDGLKISLLGIAPINLIQISAPEVVRGVTVDPDLKTVIEAAARARKAGSSLVVALAKVPVDRPLPALRDAITGSEIDVLIGIDYGRTDFTPDRWGRTFITGVPVDNRGSRILVLDLDLVDGRPAAVDSSVEIVAPEVCPPDPVVARELDSYEKQALAPMREKVGTTSTPLARAYKAESTLGNVVTDAMRHAAKAQLALLNAGAVQDDLVAGEITVRDLFRVLPFDDTIVSVTATGRQLELLLQEILDRGSRYHVSGASYRALESAEGGDRLESVFVGGQPLSPTTTYVLATTDYILKRTRTLPGARPTVLGSLREALVSHIKKQAAPLSGKAEGRVIFQAKPRPGK